MEASSGTVEPLVPVPPSSIGCTLVIWFLKCAAQYLTDSNFGDST